MPKLIHIIEYKNFVTMLIVQIRFIRIKKMDLDPTLKKDRILVDFLKNKYVGACMTDISLMVWLFDLSHPTPINPRDDVSSLYKLYLWKDMCFLLSYNQSKGECRTQTNSHCTIWRKRSIDKKNRGREKNYGQRESEWDSEQRVAI